MSPLTVWLGTAMYTFAGDRDVTIGRAVGCDVRIVFRPAISRVHAVLRVQDGQWTIVDDSRHGIFVDGERVTTLAVDDDVSVTLGAPNGPRLTFRTTTHPLAIASRPILNSAAPVPRSAPPGWPQVAVPPSTAGVPRAAQPVSRVPVGALVIGRGAGSGVVVDDPLASRTHALLIPTPTGITIRDHGSNNGTFVNGTRISTTTLHPGDVVTIGTTDLHFTGTTLVSARTGTRAGGLHAAGLRQVVDGRALLTDVSFTATPGTVTAVIGPSGAGKSTLIKLLAGATHPSAGRVSFDGHDVHAEYASLRSRIGMVPQDDVVHRQLTVRRALDYAAELRLPPDTTRADRAAVIARVVGELDLGDHVDTRVDNLSGGQRKRVSVAMELLTEPSLLILDEPTSGLDPALDRQVMSMLRALADAGRVVVVVTHSLTYLHMCDQVLLLAPGGKTAYVGAPVHIATTMGTTDWADIFAYVSTQPDHAHATHLARTHGDPPPVPTPPPAVAAGPPAHAGDLRLTWTVARRQVRLIVSDRGYFAFLAALPFVLGALSLAVPGSTGLGLADPRSSSPNEPAQVLILLNIAAVFMGTALTIRDLVGERTIFRREQSVGLSAAAYLAAKITVYAAAACLQTAILTTIVVTGKGGPTQGAVLLGNPVLELYVTLAATAVVSALVGLAMSAVAKSTEQILPMLVVAIMLSIVFSGGLIPVTGRAGLDQLSWLLPARWGFAASASTVDLRSVTPLVPAAERLWSHHPAWWLFDMMVLILLGAIAAAFVRWQLRLPGYLGRAPIAPGASPSPSRPVTGAGHGSTAPPWFRDIRPRQS